MKTPTNLTIFSVFHKEYPIPRADYIKPIQVGAALSPIKLGFITDDVGDNISERNPTWCELTALYWIWKNLNQIDTQYIGLVHYRRYFFSLDRVSLLFRSGKFCEPITYHASPDLATLNVLSSDSLKNKITRQLELGRVIVPKSIPLKLNRRACSLKDQYIYNHIREDWALMEETVELLYPEYGPTLKQFQSNTKLYAYNMFIADKVFVSNYCEWLFPIIFAMEQKIKLSSHAYQSRALGFLAERLFNLYIWHNRVNVKEFPVLFLD
ncbi:MAG: DUF4422 domain-containing protein [Sphingobacteriaceae bacterium]